MAKTTLRQLYAEHTGKVSDKWSSYLTEYDRLLDDFRDKPVRVFEIGIQNGGSLDIWSQYFSNASAVIGCDVNPTCAQLSYDDPRIVVIVGDANAADVHKRVLERSPSFDIIIDDGSHLSSDIIKSFALYFPVLAEGGAFIAEDLHCSYWDDFEGGLFDPYSSISFFKRLADVINHEHWGIPRARADILRGFLAKYNCALDVDALSQVHSVEFVNSMCVIRKAPAADNCLGHRVIAGSLEAVVPGHQTLHDKAYQFDSTYDQSKNPWSIRSAPPDEAIEEVETSLARVRGNLSERESQIAGLHGTLMAQENQVTSLRAILREREDQVADLRGKLRERESVLVSLRGTLQERESQIADLCQASRAYVESTSWKLTRPVRFLGRKLRQIRYAFMICGVLLLNLGSLKNIAAALRDKGLRQSVHYFRRLQSPEYAVQLANDRGLPPELLGALVAVGTAVLEANDRIAAFRLGKTTASSNPALGHLRIQVDTPHGPIRVTGGSLLISGWAVDLKEKGAAAVRVRLGKAVHDLHPQPRSDVQKVFATHCDLPLNVGFSIVVPLSMGLHRMWIDVAGPDGGWIPVRRVLVLRVPRIRLKRRKRTLSYKAWTHLEQKRLKAEVPEITRHIDVMLHQPIFTMIIDARQGSDGWRQTLQSLQHQIYPHHELRLFANTDAALPSPLEQDILPLRDLSLADVAGDYIVLLECGQTLSRNALYEFANAVNQYPDLDLIYGDEDHVTAEGLRRDPFHKPDWSPDYLETFNYLAFPACFRTAIAHGCFDNADAYDLALRFTERSTKIWHVAKVLGHTLERPVDEQRQRRDCARNLAALQGRLSRTGRQGVVSEHEVHRGCYDIRLDLKRSPLVSVVIPTAGKTVTIEGREIDLITNVVDQIRNNSTYKNLEIIVVDNGDLSQRQQRTLAQQDCKRVTYGEALFNIPKKLRLGASIACGELFLLMNDDIEVLTPNWIERMVEHFEKPHVGVVGAKLLYPDGRTQHVGVVHNYGNPDHVRRLFPKDEAGYYFSTCGVRNYSAVTGAVMMTSASVYREVGGYSEELAVSFNDTDYCLKVRENGLSIVYAPRVELIHMESQSRVASADLGEVAWYHKRWAPHIVSDPYYNEQFLTVASPTFVPNVNQRLV